MYKIKGKIKFDPINITNKHKKQSWKKVAIVNFGCDICEYYSWFIKKRFNLILNKPLRGTHFTVINDVIDDNIYNQAKQVFDGKEINVTYDPEFIRSSEKGHWWLKAYSEDATNIRNVMGLGKPYFAQHITIGLATHLQLEHSKYITRQCIKFDI